MDICETLYEYSGLPGRCVTMATVVWIHTGNAISCLLADIILTVYPWRIIRKVTYVSDKEKWSVAVGMGLVGLSMLVGIVKIALMSLIPSADHGKVDYTCKHLTRPPDRFFIIISFAVRLLTLSPPQTESSP